MSPTSRTRWRGRHEGDGKIPTLIYNPGVKVYIYASRKGSAGIIDVSEDLTEGTMQRRQDGVSSFQFGLSNPQRKYDGLFAPNDRIVVMMKRLTWVRVFTGLLNSVPLVSAWPRVVSLASSCSLKRLQYWYWDSHAAATQQMIRDALTVTTGGTDGGITNVLLTILNDVVGWPGEKIHIGQIPDRWMKIAEQIAKNVDTLAEESDALAKEFSALLTQQGVIAGNAVGNSTGVLADGKYGNTSYSGAQLRIAEGIYTMAASLGMSNKDALTGLIVAMDESGLRNLDHGDLDSIGVFQQRPSQGWGTKAQIMDVTYSTTKFLTTLQRVGNRATMTEAQAATTVQRNGGGAAVYQKFLPDGQAMMAVLNTAPTGTSGVAPPRPLALSTNPTGPPGPAAGATPAPGYNPNPRSVDSAITWARQEVVNPTRDWYRGCLAFVNNSYGLTFGSADAMAAWRFVQPGDKHTDSNPPIGACVYWSTGSPQGHVALAIGNGQIASTDILRKGKVDIVALGDISSKWGSKYLGWTPPIFSSSPAYKAGMPGLTYDGGGSGSSAQPGAVGATTPNALPPSQTFTTADQLAGYNANNPFDKLFGDNTWAPTETVDPGMELAEGLVGIRALLNDQPLLAYLKNLFAATLRSFCSAPNGDLIAWFPDYYGLWGTAAKMVIEPIELQDFTVDWADDFFVTHQFTVAGRGKNMLDEASGNISNPMLMMEQNGADIRTMTLGIASIDIPGMMYALLGIEATPQDAKNFAEYIYRRFGARPSWDPMPGLQGPKAEFFSAIYMFLRNWAQQYNADVPLTFMPEVWPGMLLQIPEYDFQAYVMTVTHSFRFGEGGAFTTTVNISSPARIAKADGSTDHVLMGLPLAGGL